MSTSPRYARPALLPWYRRPVTKIISFVAVAWVVIVASFSLVMDVAYANRFLPGTSVQGHDLSGMTAAQAQLVLDRMQADISVDLTLNGVTTHATGAELGITVDRQQILSSLAEQSRTPLWILRVGQHPTTGLSISVDADQFNTWLDSNYSGQLVAPVNAGLVFDSGTSRFTVTAASSGVGVNTADLDTIADTLEAHAGKGSFTLNPTDIAPQITDDQAKTAADWINQRLTTTCSLDYNGSTVYTLTPADIATMASITPGSTGLTVTFDSEKIQSFIQQTLQPSLDTAPVNQDVLTDASGAPVGLARSGANGRSLADTDSLGSSIAQCLTSNNAAPINLSFTDIPFSTQNTVTLSPTSSAVQAQLTYLLAHVTEYNTAEWGDYNSAGGDCANFASQGLYVRGIPMDLTWYSHGPRSASSAWTFAPSMDAWMKSKGWTRLSLDQLDQLKLGDIGVFDWNLDGRADHIMTVSRIDDTPGGVDVYFVSHNDDGAYRNLTDVITKDHPGANAWFYSVP